jgi:hypothetical protein
VSAFETVRRSAKVRNISRGGISLQLDARFEPGNLVSVELSDPNGQPLFTALAYVLHVKDTAKRQFALGCAFAMELSQDDLALLAGKQHEASEPDRAKDVCHGSVAYWREGDGPSAKKTAGIVHISHNGISLVVDETEEIGSLLNLQFLRPRFEVPFQILASVVRVASAPGTHVLGCTFIRDLSEDECTRLQEK